MPTEPIFWNWLLLLCLFLVIEALTKSFFFIFWAIAPSLLSIITFLFPKLSLPLQALCFSLFSCLSISLWWLYCSLIRKNNKVRLKYNTLIGRQFMLQTPISRGYGYLEVDDHLWIIRGKDLPAGEIVIVTKVYNQILEVAPIE
ncbi:NfeD family protein [Suttonella ornithocola]|uniref:Inner membrane protein ybbJ n=1 Tax=Suttonella ornithocola TaxID=279832 RepID=A0A380MX21_9GAMM|nr:NfeD family protein [Suttonella ornithocola]SUO97150.1 Inner membrane protein ybbJ [Suttonella ornithocola]